MNKYARYGSTVEFSDDEDTVSVDGSKYAARTSEPGKCTGCVFKEGFGCALCDAVLRQEGLQSAKMSRCGAGQRKDDRSITWRIK